MGRATRLVAPIALALAMTGCARGCTSRQPPIHLNPNMDDQPRYAAQSSSEFFGDGMAMRAPVEGTVARTGPAPAPRPDGRFLTGREADGTPVATLPVPVDDALLSRGEDRFDIYCAPCHHRRGDGRGILFTRANVPTTSLHIDRIRSAPDGALYDVITNGLGLMPSYRYPLSPMDRWAVIAHVRKLQAAHDP